MRSRSFSSLTAIAATILLLTGCNDLSPSESLAQARERWGRHGPASYGFTLMRGCECLDVMTGPVAVIVTDGIVTSRIYAGGATVTAQYQALFPHVEGLFALIDSAIASHALRVDVQYDRVLGYPMRIAIDYGPGVDDEVTTYVSAFAAH